MFSQRLDLLMELTGISASVLGKACALDSSHVSRLRRGSRPLPKKPSFLSAMSAYFAKRIRADYQKKSLCELMRLNAWPEEKAQAAEMIELWLRGEERISQVEPILHSFIRAAGTSVKREEAPQPLRETETPRACYYGPEGKRAAVAQLFSLILRETAPQTVLLFSDEEMGWLYEDPDFAALWAQECVRVLSAGNRVKIIHAIHRDIHEMLEGVAKWVPLYMTGRVKPYYYPRLRDGVFQRTLFVAPQTAAVVSGSVDRKTGGMLHAFYDDPAAVGALALEYENLLALCRPLMQIFNRERAAEFLDTYTNFLCAKGDMICLGSLPTLSTMPEAVAASLQARAPESRILETRNRLASALFEYLEIGHYTELLADPPPGAADIPVPFAELLGSPGLHYTREEHQAHRAHLETLKKHHKNYRLRSAGNVPDNLTLCGKDSRGILMCKNDTPNVIFGFDEPNMTSAFWEYLCRRAEEHS
ncbi:MAG: hypothetical protein EOM54_11210 [Clostridia bacterium]|nr:hypothetical protein [Clostridia bacterium]